MAFVQPIWAPASKRRVGQLVPQMRTKAGNPLCIFPGLKAFGPQRHAVDLCPAPD
ncbi:MAG TPA: hypothetical protein VGF36_16760 [Rhodopila sp.]